MNIISNQLASLFEAFPDTSIAGCSGAGEIIDGKVYENSIVYTVIEFASH